MSGYQFRYYSLNISYSLPMITFALPHCTVVLSVEVVYFITSRRKVESPVISTATQDRLNSHAPIREMGESLSRLLGLI
jgi:hypothetical protein